MALPFVGPSYTLATRKAAIDRAVNLMLVGMETPGKAPFIMKSVDGLVLFASLGYEIRGSLAVGSRGFAVAGSTLYEVYADGTSTARGTLASSTGAVEMAYGLFQLVIVDGANGYVLTTGTNAFAQITSDGFYGSVSVSFVDNFFIFVRPNSGQFYISSINDALIEDPLNFASAESSPDNIVTCVVSHEELVLFGELTAEVQFNGGGADFPFQRNRGVTLEVGCLAPHSAKNIDSSVIWIGKDLNGSGMVFQFIGGQARIISTTAVTEALQKSTDLTKAVAYCYQDAKQTFWCVNAPGLTSTWCYEVGTQSWHERCDIGSDGQLIAHRALNHSFMFGLHIVGDANGNLYRMDKDTYTFAGSPIVRRRQSPHTVIPNRKFIFFNAFYLDATTGECGQAVGASDECYADDYADDYTGTSGTGVSAGNFAELSYSNDSGASWSDPVLRSLGAVGERFARLTWRRLGRSRDRVWRLDYSGNAPYAIVDAMTDETEGLT